PESETLALYLESGLSADERDRVNGHLADCDECRRTVSLASSLEAAPAAPVRVNEVLLQRVVSGARRRRFLPMAVAAAVILVGVVSLSLLKSPEEPVPTVAREQSRLPAEVA